MRGPFLFLVFVVVGAATGALLVRPAPAAELDADPFQPAVEETAAPAATRTRPSSSPHEATVERRDAMGTVLVACATPGSCQLTLGGQRRLVPLVEGREVERIELTVEWQSSTATTRRLVVDLLDCAPGACSQDAEPLASTLGSSPLALYFVSGDDAPRTLTLRVAPEDLVPGSPELHAVPFGQAFTITGTATFQ